MNKMAINEIVEGIINEHTTLIKDQAGYFHYTIYMDHDAELTMHELKSIGESDSKREKFYKVLEETVAMSVEHSIDELLSEIERSWPENAPGGLDYDDHAEIVQEILGEYVLYDFPYEHYLKQEHCVNILIDAGDGNYDYVLNNFASYNSSDEVNVGEESGLLWLVRQQGYSKEQLEALIKDRNCNEVDSPFLRTILRETDNVTTHMNALTFFVRMTLEDYMTMMDKQYNVVLDSSVSCGLYDLWNGAGGSLEIELEKEIEVPFEMMEPHIEGTRGYGVDSIYGIDKTFWKYSVKGCAPNNKLDK